ncbi:MAG: hypothetical protein R3253_09440 [Longimicrobiales bacterium]|nr:hypothetical protein [Longimicrobiales bacterium]
MKKPLLIVAAVALLAACGGDADDDARTAADTLTRAQKDSIVADLPIPGAGAVGAAMRSRDRANERTATHDTIR